MSTTEQNNENFYSSNLTLNIELPKSYTFEPKEDITTYELSQCLMFLFGNAYGLNNASDEVKRHFREQ